MNTFPCRGRCECHARCGATVSHRPGSEGGNSKSTFPHLSTSGVGAEVASGHGALGFNQRLAACGFGRACVTFIGPMIDGKRGVIAAERPIRYRQHRRGLGLEGSRHWISQTFTSCAPAKPYTDRDIDFD
ncbi:cysteine--1-D-myo-inosityl 2-amino-2-deoxy-alpha-D-glucopyranoside ligase [Anopheles sinensis]|uniref:Cysteine--1-D-myo-inosityl 2-amino-2-deoxy-alpha-D-glucopyranoside ligase n=1 Tax=Anopheles sinensis TaxID=74873 RepID=A0A084W9T1_ANOSI|nr:cysteine--1-D-myo-inosityl 2-amino-2-deoxy-alpha-D-glucopyranoside ligase [Anopheles sinensis]